MVLEVNLIHALESSLNDRLSKYYASGYSPNRPHFMTFLILNNFVKLFISDNWLQPV